jgi:hypothetical protein
MALQRTTWPIRFASAIGFAASMSAPCFVDRVDAQMLANDLHRMMFGDSDLISETFGLHKEIDVYAGWPPHLVATRAVGPPLTLRFDNLNLAVTMPHGPWNDLNPRRTDAHSCRLIGRRKPTIIVSLAVEPVGIESNVTNSSLLAWSEARMRTLPSGKVLPGEQELDANGLSVLRTKSQLWTTVRWLTIRLGSLLTTAITSA